MNKNNDNNSSNKHKQKKNKQEKTKQKNENNNDKRFNPWMITTLILVIVIIGITVLIFFNLNNLTNQITNLNSSNTSNVINNANNANTSNSNKVILIEEYSDFQCPYCGRVQPALKKLKELYGNKIKIEFNHFPLSFHEFAQKAAEASECARDQNKFWEYHDLLYANQSALAIDNLKAYAKQLNLDQEKFNSCLDSGEKTAIVSADFAEGQAKGVSGTPAFFIDGEKLVGAQPIEKFQEIINKKLNEGNTNNVNDVNVVSTANDPEIELIVLEAADCTLCQTSNFVKLLKQDQLFPTIKERILSSDSEEGKKLIKDNSVKVLPAFFLGKEVKNAANYNKLNKAVIENGNYLMIINAAVEEANRNLGVMSTSLLIEKPVVNDAIIKGDENASITIIEFSDFQCPYCKKFVDETLPSIIKDYVDTGKVKIVFKQFPLSFHEFAQKAAEASECARDQNKFWEYHDLLYANQSALDVNSLKKYAINLALDENKFNDCLDNSVKAIKVLNDLKEGQSLGINGTPGFIINGEMLSGAYPFDVFKQIIEDKLAK